MNRIISASVAKRTNHYFHAAVFSAFCGNARIVQNACTLHVCDTEIDLPDGHDVVVDDGEVDLGESIEAAEQEELKWTDKGIDLLLQREGGAPAASS